MLPRSLRRLCLCLAALMSASIDQSSCHQSSSRRGTAFSHHRFARLSSPRLSNHLRRRSIPLNKTPSLPSPHVTSGAANRWRRSIDLDQSDSGYASQSLDQERDQAEKMWEEFVASTDGEDLDFSDCDDDDENTSNSVPSGSNDSQSVGSLGSSSLTSVNEDGNPTTSSNSQDQQSSKGQSNGYNYGEDQGKSADQVNKAKEANNKKEDEKSTKAQEESYSKVQAVSKQDPDEEAAQTKKQQEAAQAEKKQEADQAEKDKEAAQTKKQQKAAQAEKKQEAYQAEKDKQAAEAKKEQDAAEAKKEQDAAEAKKEQDAAEAKKEQDAAEAKKEQDEAAQKAKKDKDAYRVTDLKKIPGTSVTTGTATKPKDETYSTPPPSESDEHSGDATFFTPDTGACGILNTPNDYIVAVSHLLYDSFPSQGGNPNTNRICGKKIRAHYKGKSVEVSVTDRCEACDMYSLDFTESAFLQLGSKEEGRLHGMTWTFI